MVGQNFDAKTPEEMNQKYPMGSEGNVSFRMVVTYWDMAAGLVNRGLIDDELSSEFRRGVVCLGACAGARASYEGRFQESARLEPA